MADAKKIAKKAVKATASVGLIATEVALKVTKYGLHFSAEMSLALLGGAKNMANEFAGGGNSFNIGEKIIGKLPKAIDKAMDVPINIVVKAQKKVKSM